MGTLLDLKTRIKDELSRSTDPDIDGQIVLAIADAIRFYSGRFLYFLEGESPQATVAGQPSYTLPTRGSDDIFHGLYVATLADSAGRWPLKRRSWTWYRERATDPANSTGRPSDFTIFGAAAWLWPTPDASYTLTFSADLQLADLSQDNDSNAWTTDAEPLIRTHAKIDLLVNVIREETAPWEVQLLSAQERNWLSVLTRRTAQHASSGRVRASDW